MDTLDFKETGFWENLEALCTRWNSPADVSAPVAGIIKAVRRHGAEALCAYTEQFDGAKLAPGALGVDRAELEAAAAGLQPAERRAIREAIRCVRDYHKATLPKDWRSKNRHGATVGENYYPLRRVGLYIPGGSAPLVSTVVMTATLAKLAGVPEIAVFTPPRADGTVDAGLLAALHLVGVAEVYRIGGVQAIAAAALGVGDIRAVDKVFGPGNAYVMEAKRQLFGEVGVDLLPGPSEVLLIADAQANPQWLAADLMAQAEHGSGKEKVYLVSTSRKVIDETATALEAMTPGSRHGKAIATVLERAFLAVKTGSLEQAAEVANYLAPEHLELHVAPKAQKPLLKRITTAGAILVGEETPTVLGDFTAGPSHTLPTGRTGRFFSGLRATDFLRRTSIVQYNRAACAKAAPVVEVFARLEQLEAHGRSLELRLR